MNKIYISCDPGDIEEVAMLESFLVMKYKYEVFHSPKLIAAEIIGETLSPRKGIRDVKVNGKSFDFHIDDVFIPGTEVINHDHDSLLKIINSRLSRGSVAYYLKICVQAMMDCDGVIYLKNDVSDFTDAERTIADVLGIPSCCIRFLDDFIRGIS